ncbi:unnamed protein product [Onchocerca ochengi]|uniref:Uncharacterized protein n=1 Tax=Onchocerca ochengi TaxID=42157 RepID=A0A182EIP1_ONCOC|nr:unnamed protein product [Onchocerca ochengi]
MKYSAQAIYGLPPLLLILDRALDCFFVANVRRYFDAKFLIWLYDKINSNEIDDVMVAIICAAIENRRHHVAKYEPAKTLQLHAAYKKKLMGNIVEAAILTGLFKNEDFLILRIAMIQTMSYAAKGMRRLIANQIEEERASANERARQRMAQMDAQLRARRSCSLASESG